VELGENSRLWGWMKTAVCDVGCKRPFVELGVNGRLWNWLKTAVCEVGKRPFVMLDENGRLWGWVRGDKKLLLRIVCITIYTYRQ